MGKRSHQLGLVQVESLLAEEQDKKNHVVELEGTTKKDMWRADLDQFEAAYNEWLAEEWAEANKAPGVDAGKAKKKAAPKKKAAARLSNDSEDWAPAAKPAAAPKKKAVAGPAYGASTSAATAKPAPAKPASGASTAPKKTAAKAAPKAATAAKELKLADVFAKATTKKKAARPREEDSFSDSPVHTSSLTPCLLCFVPVLFACFDAVFNQHACTAVEMCRIELFFPCAGTLRFL